MNKNKLEKFKRLLLAKEAELEKELNNLGTENPKLKGDYETKYPNYGSSLEDSALEFESYIETLPVEYRLEKRLQEVKEALLNIEKGKYGICIKCGQPIPEKRLEIVPEAKFCVKCLKKQKK